MTVATLTPEIDQFQPSSQGSMAAITGGHLQAFQEWARVVAVGSVIPDSLRGKPADVFITVMHGLDLGFRPMQALNLVYVVKGRPSLSGEGMRTLILQAGHELEIEADNTKATARAKRAGTDRWVEATFTIEQAKAAGLSGDNWTKYTEDMLVARASTRLGRRYFPDVTNGLPGLEDILDAAVDEPKPTLAEAAKQREAGTQPAPEVLDGELVDEKAEADRLRAEVLAAEQQHTAGTDPVGVNTATGEVPVEDPDVPGWPDVDVVKPGSKGQKS